ncbi:hypothetical protein OG978_03550 [Streptomyces sp. NBC_01591]|nr:hypothetical protein [Streptomyces sp. NBC_01591]WSD66538.1 hypothetical protein OG978_03550 [Streptomyces sp. NBC_01591]
MAATEAERTALTSNISRLAVVVVGGSMVPVGKEALYLIAAHATPLG